MGNTLTLTHDNKTLTLSSISTVTEVGSVGDDTRLKLSSDNNSYLIYNSSTQRVELYVNGVKQVEWG